MLQLQPETLVSLFHQPAIFIDKAYRILASNPAYEARYGTPGANSRCFQISHQYDSPCHTHGESCPLQQAQSSGRPARCLHIHQQQDHRQYCSVEVTPVPDGRGGYLGYIEIINESESASPLAGEKALVGESPAFQALMESVHRVAPTNVSVLLEGESGTGKELIAKAIHDASEHRLGKFVVLECSGMNENLFESELFGYRKGAFTGARSDHEGLAAAASGGTLFLDEVGDIPLSLQVKLLRLLETGSFRPVGATEMERTDFRLICASHKNLKDMVAAGTFREDLYYRLATFPIHLPPLRQRKEDLPVLCEALLAKPPVPAHTYVSQAALRQLARYRFPGNIRELRNILIRASLLADDHVIQTKHLPAEITDLVSPHQRSHFAEEIQSLADLELQYLQHAQSIHQGTPAALAQRLGISERTLYRKLAKLKQTHGAANQ
ncbi:MAG: sigma 54-interacting transcriptional regulator [Pseudomonadota bacterium]|nr:sigma 54-interacting transcriptional regulator [Pseudomonadota bacterium]